MKTLPVEFKLPDEANWMAQNEDGDVCWFEYDPYTVMTIWDDKLTGGVFLYNAKQTGTYQENWQDTLERIE